MLEARSLLPHDTDLLFATDSGLETTLIFKEGYDLPNIEAFVLLKSEAGRARLRTYYEKHARIAVDSGFGFILTAPTWRANPDWGVKIGIDRAELDALNRDAIVLMREVRAMMETRASPMVVSGCIGPRGDGYVPGENMSAEEAWAYHAFQVRVFADMDVDMVEAITMTNIPEAAGVALAAKAAGVPSVISFTVETDGRLPSGDTLDDAIHVVDAVSGNAPAYYMINCAHPDHFMPMLAEGGVWLPRLKGLRANASRCSHAELDNSPTLDEGDPVELGDLYHEIRTLYPHITVLGGCCGTDDRHVARICAACATSNAT